jgi:hypothetical protein
VFLRQVTSVVGRGLDNFNVPIMFAQDGCPHCGCHLRQCARPNGQQQQGCCNHSFYRFHDFCTMARLFLLLLLQENALK